MSILLYLFNASESTLLEADLNVLQQLRYAHVLAYNLNFENF